MLGWLRRQVRLGPPQREGQAYAAQLAAANALRDNNCFAAAADQYREAIRLGCSDPGIRKQLANMLKDSGKFAEAEGEYRALLGSNPDDADTLIQMGHLFKLRQDPAAAVDYFEAALTKEPLNQLVITELAALRSSAAARSGEARSAHAGNGTADGRIAALETEQRVLRRDLERVNDLLGQAAGWSPEDRLTAETLRNQWNAFVPLMVNMSSTIVELGSRLDELTARLQRDARILHAEENLRERLGGVTGARTAAPQPETAGGPPNWTGDGSTPHRPNGADTEPASAPPGGSESISADGRGLGDSRSIDVPV